MKRFLLFFICIGCSMSLYSQVILLHNQNTRPLTARSIGLGNATAAITDDAASLFINPAGMSHIVKKKSIVFSGETEFRAVSLADNGGVPSLSSAKVSNSKPAFAVNQAALAFDIPKSNITMGLGYARLGGNLAFRENWEVRQQDFSTRLIDKYTWNHYGNTQLMSVGISTAVGRVLGCNRLSFGAAYNRITGSRHFGSKRELNTNGTITNNTDVWENSRYRGDMISWGLQLTEKLYNPTLLDKNYDDIVNLPSGFMLSLSGNSPYTRKNTVDNSSGLNDFVSYTRKPGVISLGLAYRVIVEEVLRSFEFEGVPMTSKRLNSTITPVFQMDFMNLNRHRIYYPNLMPEDTSLNGMSSNRVSLGIEFWNAETDLFTRFGYCYQQYARKTGSLVNPNEQMASNSLCAGVGNSGFDIALRIEFFKHKKVLKWNNGSGLDYKGAVFHICSTIRLFSGYDRKRQ